MSDLMIFVLCLVLFVYYLSAVLSLFTGDFYKTKKEFFLDLIPFFGIYSIVKKHLDKLP